MTLEHRSVFFKTSVISWPHMLIRIFPFSPQLYKRKERRRRNERRHETAEDTVEQE